MSKLLSILVMGLIALASGQPNSNGKPNSEVNFAFGGADSGVTNLALITNPELVTLLEDAGLMVVGLQQQLEWAAATVGPVKPNRDLFWLFVGTNDFSTALFSGQLPDPAAIVSNIAAALATIYNDFGGRYFVLSNLVPYGVLPDSVRNIPAELLPQLNLLSSAFSFLLATAVADFQAQNTDAHVVLVDLESLFLSLASDPNINTSDPCIETSVPPCDGYIFVDGTHTTTWFNKLWAQEAHDKLVEAVLNDGNPDNDEDVTGRLFRRMITFGDSYSDTGSLNDVYLRSTGASLLPDPPFFEGRFSDGPNVIDQLEDLMNVKYPSSHYVQEAQSN